MKKSVKLRTNIVIISAFAFVFHIVWEYLQCGPFFIHMNLQPTHFDMIVASLGDVVITLTAFFVIAWLSRNLYWINEVWGRWQWFAMLSLALIFSFSIELFSLRADRWAYAEITPLMFGQVSILPVLQLLIIFPFTFYSSKIVMQRI